jgi:hypothetical protein
MEGRTTYAGPDGLARLKVDMVVTWRQRKRGGDVGYSSEYFRGVIAGLALVDALDAVVPFSVAPFITDRRYAVESPTPDKQGNTMNNPPRPKTHGLSSGVPEHLLEVFQQTRHGILGERVPRPDAGAARGRAAEIAPVIETAVRGLDSLLQLVDVAEARPATRPPADR